MKPNTIALRLFALSLLALWTSACLMPTESTYEEDEDEGIVIMEEEDAERDEEREDDEELADSDEGPDFGGEIPKFGDEDDEPREEASAQEDPREQMNQPEPEAGGVRLVQSSWFITSGGNFPTFLAHTFGGLFDAMGSVTLHNSASQPREVLLEVELIGYSRASRRVITLEGGERAEVGVTPNFDFAGLYEITSPIHADVEVRVIEGGELVDLYGERIIVDPLQRIRWFLEEEGEIIDMRPFVATLITPEDRDHAIQTLLTEAAAQTQSKSIYGYQAATREDIEDQIGSVYRALQARGMVYTSVTGGFFDGAQYVKLPADSLATNSANCIDGALVFASAFEAMGMDPLLVFMSGHALVGVWVDPEHTIWLPIETTMIGSHSFEDAVSVGLETIEQQRASNDPLLVSYDVKTLREAGILPINR